MSDALEVTTARPPIDPLAANRWLEGRVPGAAGAGAWLHGEVARRMEDRLQWIRQAPVRWIDWSPTLGGWEAAVLIGQRYPQAGRLVVETASSRQAMARQRLRPPRWQFWNKPPPVLSQAPTGGADMLWSNMALHAHPDPQELLRQWHDALKVDGFLMFSCLGPDSLREMREVYGNQHWPSPAHPYTDMHDWGDLLVQAGFAEPVMDMERITLTYADAHALLADLRTLGRNWHAGRFSSLRGNAWRRRLEEVLADPMAPTVKDGRLCLTFEVIYGHALKPAPRPRVAAQTQVPLHELKAMLTRRPVSD